jgi:hypothetical protein
MRGGNKQQPSRSPEAGRSRGGKVVAGAVVSACLLIFLALVLKQTSTPPPIQSAPPTVVQAPTAGNLPELVARTQGPRKTSSVPVEPEKMTPEQLVAELARIGVDGPITPEQAVMFDQDLQELSQRGKDAVPAIFDFLRGNQDLAYNNIEGGDQLGYATLRSSLIDTLDRIGGPAAQAALLSTMQHTSHPAEMLNLAKDLDRQAPGQYRDQILAAARSALQAGSSNAFGTNVELGPVLRVLQTYNASASLTNSAQNAPAQFYDAVQLANMPDGKGLPSLLQMEKQSTGDTQLIATEMIAQLAGKNSDALGALTQLAQNGRIQASDWIQLAPILGGDQYKVDPSGQNYEVVGASSPDEINQRINLIDSLMNAVAENSGAAKALQQERNVLTARLTGN